MESFSILMWKIDGFTARFGGGDAWLVDGWCHSAAQRRVNNNTCLTTTVQSRHNTRRPHTRPHVEFGQSYFSTSRDPAGRFILVVHLIC